MLPSRRDLFRLGAAVPLLHHPDATTDAPGTEYYFLGNGRIIAAVQSGHALTHGGLLLLSADHFTHKYGSLLYTESSGLERTRLVLLVAGKAHVADGAKVRWEYPDRIPTVCLEWTAGPLAVAERLWCPAGESVLVREVAVRNPGTAPVEADALMPLRPNPLLFDDYDVDRARGILTASGYHRLQLCSTGPAVAGDRDLRLPLGRIAPGGEVARTLLLALDQPAALPARAPTAAWWNSTTRYSGLQPAFANLRTSHGGSQRRAEAHHTEHLFRVSQSGICAAVAASGKMDGGLLQYNLEWVRDAAMVASGACLAGMPEVANAILERLITRSVDEEGRTLDSGRRRPPETIELDQNGALLSAFRTLWAWTGDDSLIRRHWSRLRAVADYPLQPLFRDPATGLVKNSREFWERGPSHGVREGYELSYQTWTVVGLRVAAEMARHLGEHTTARRWSDASALMRASMLRVMVDSGRFIKRRLAGGAIQNTLEPPHRESMPPGMPLRVEKVSYCDPDAASALPIALGLVDAAGDLAGNTLASLETLWNQRWTIGGYGRYHVTSEPDSPGPWPLASLFIARAYAERGDWPKVWRVLDWLLNVPGGKSGGWFEFYGKRPVPPLSPAGFIPWTWAEILTLLVHHIAGFRPSPSGITLRPRLPAGLDRLDTRFTVHGRSVRLTLRRGPASAAVNGQSTAFDGSSLLLPPPARETYIELQLP